MQLKIKNLTKTFGNNTVLKDINISLEDVHSLVLIGPSGCGKTTLLRILAGLETPDSGYLELNNHHIDFNENNLREYRKSIGMVFQAYNLFPHFTALENVMLPLEKVHNYTYEKARETASDFLNRFQLMAHADKKPLQLSGGQKQRVAISRAVAIRPQVLMLDEPTSALDPEFTSEVLDMIGELRKEKKDLILVTHEMGFAKTAADYVIFLHEGKILEEGHSEDIFGNPKSPKLINFLNKILKY